MIFFIYSQVNQKSLVAQLGLPQYSYFFVLDRFIPLLERIGQVIIVDSPEEVGDRMASLNVSETPCVFISFTPPQHSPSHVPCPVITVFAWEFSNLPSEAWDNDASNDWRQVFARQAGAIPLSVHTEGLVREAMGVGYPVKAIPVPVWDGFADLRQDNCRSPYKSRAVMELAANVVDSGNYVFNEQEFRLINAEAQFNTPDWNGRELLMSYALGSEHSAYLGGFYEPESWGVWSRLKDPWILLPVNVAGAVSLEIECAGYGPNAGRTIAIEVGDQIKEFALLGHFSTHQLTFQVKEKTNIIKFHDLSQEPVSGAVDPRTMGMGLKNITLSLLGGLDAVALVGPVAEMRRRTLQLDGVVYTSVLNPADHRKNWEDILTAFCFAFKDCSDATLILKMTHRSLTPFLGRLHLLLEQVAPFKCRVLVLHGYFEEAEFKQLISHSSYYVNASLCEGLCLPLMEFMCCGVPALATRNTAMIDYIDGDSSFVIASSPAPTIWPHDPRQMIRTLQNRVNWQSIVDAFQQSYHVAKSDPARYQIMSRQTLDRMRAFCSMEATETALRALLVEVFGGQMEVGADAALIASAESTHNSFSA